MTVTGSNWIASYSRYLDLALDRAHGDRLNPKDRAMTVLIHVDTSKQVGDPDHLKVFANADAAETWFEENDPEGVAFEYEVLE